jgi:trehalose-6-phosphate hydrolase
MLAASIHMMQGTPWLEVAQNYPEINAEDAIADLNSVFYFYKRLIELRKQVPVITDGCYEDLLPEHTEIFAYARENDEQILLSINNYYGEEAELVLPDRFDLSRAKILLSNYQGVSPGSKHQALRPYETRILLIES